MAVARIARRADPRSDPRYQRVVSKLDADSRRLKQHPPPSRKSDESAKAAKGPANEKAAGARAKQVDKLEQSDTPKPQTASFLSMLRAEIEKVMPKTLGDTEKFMKGGSGNEISRTPTRRHRKPASPPNRSPRFRPSPAHPRRRSTPPRRCPRPNRPRRSRWKTARPKSPTPRSPPSRPKPA
ncbi:MAG: hypothetical protein JF591_03135 [Lysobacter sp.]|nr:hypothetical protein [Lysobacter sp.]